MDIILILQYIVSLLAVFVAVLGLSALKKHMLRLSIRLSEKARRR